MQAVYRGYHVRRNILRHLKPKKKKSGPKAKLPGPPLDVAASREIDLGPVIVSYNTIYICKDLYFLKQFAKAS